MIRRALRSMLVLLLLAALSGPLVACGRKGPPEAPEGTKGEFPRKYPQ